LRRKTQVFPGKYCPECGYILYYSNIEKNKYVCKRCNIVVREWKVYLISPSERGILKNAGDRPPLGILYIASYLRKNDINVKVADMNHKSLDEVLEEVERFNPDCIGISFTTPMFKRAMIVARKLKKFIPNPKLVAGGPHPSADPESCLKVFDYVVVGEGEKAMLNIVRNEPEERIIHEPFIQDLDSIPRPARDLVIMWNYELEQDGERTATLISSRGCIGGCVYCSRKSLGNKFRAHSAEYVVREMEELWESYGYTSFYFLDDIFTYDKKRVLEICKLIKVLLPKISFRITTRADMVTKTLLKRLKGAGLKILSLGIEHADNDVLKKSGKGMTVEDNERIIKWCKELGIKVKGFFILNLPGASINTIRKTLHWAKEMDLDDADFYILTAFPGSCLWNNPENFGMKILDRDFNYFQARQNLTQNINILNKNIPQKDRLLKYWKLVMEDWKKWKKRRN